MKNQPASHYLKIVLDAIFCSQGGDFKNEIICKRAETVKGNFGQGSQRFDGNTDTILFYSKSENNKFNPIFSNYSQEYVDKFYKYIESGSGRRYQLISMTAPGGAAKGNPLYEVMGVTRYWRYSKEKMNKLIEQGLVVQTKKGNVPRKKQYLDEGKGVPIQSLWNDLPALHSQDKERLGYPTQKPEALLERIIKASSNEGDIILDAYCGCGTTIAVAERLNRPWIGIDITYQSISLILKRLEDSFGKNVLDKIQLNGIPKNMESAVALANKKDDRTRKEFEKWAVLTYSNNRAVINTKKGADQGIDGVAYFQGNKDDREKIIFQVKSGKVKSGDIRDLKGTMTLQQAEIGILITLKPPTKAMIKTAKAAGIYQSKYMNQSVDKIQIITIQEILEDRKRIDIGLMFEVLKSAEKQRDTKAIQTSLDL